MSFRNTAQNLFKEAKQEHKKHLETTVGSKVAEKLDEPATKEKIKRAIRRLNTACSVATFKESAISSKDLRAVNVLVDKTCRQKLGLPCKIILDEEYDYDYVNREYVVYIYGWEENKDI